MRNIVRLAAVIYAAAFLTSCATGPKYEEVESSIPGLTPSNGRIYFYRNVSMLIGAGLQPAVLLNGTKVGNATPGGFFFVDHSPGRSRHLAIPLKLLPVLRQLFRFAHTRVVLARKRSSYA